MSSKKKTIKLKISSHQDTQHTPTSIRLQYKGPPERFYTIEVNPDHVFVQFGRKIKTKGGNQWWTQQRKIITLTLSQGLQWAQHKKEERMRQGYTQKPSKSLKHKQPSSLPISPIVSKKKSYRGRRCAPRLKLVPKKGVKPLELPEVVSLPPWHGLPMLAHRFYDANTDHYFQETGHCPPSVSPFFFNRNSGKRNSLGRWSFFPRKTLYLQDPTGWYISPKYDGVRAIWTGQNLVTRNNNIINIPAEWKSLLPPHHRLDGELHAGHGNFPIASGLARRKQGIQRDAIEEWKIMTYSVFDIPDPKSSQVPFSSRYQILHKIVRQCCQKWTETRSKCPIQLVEHHVVQNMEEAHLYYRSYLHEGVEGAILREPRSGYQLGRSFFMLKWKPILDGEAQIINYEEGSGKNLNRLGHFIVKLLEPSPPRLITFSLSGRLSDVFRSQYVWSKGKLISTPPVSSPHYPTIGDIVTFTYMELSTDTMSKPRHPIYQRIRHKKTSREARQV